MLKSIRHPAVALLLLASPYLFAQPSSAPPDTIAIEAESAVQVKAPWQVKTDETCAGGSCLVIPEGAGKPPEVVGRNRYVARVEKKGKYRLWVRALWNDGEGNSIVLHFGQQPLVVGQDGVYGRWHWVKGPDVELKPGNLTVYVFNREDGVALDRLLLVPGDEFVPRGKEGLTIPSGWAAQEFYFADDFSRSAEAPVEPWKKIRGDWKILFSLDPNRLPNFYSYEGKSRDSALAITGYSFWQNYRVDVALKPFECREAGLVFSYRDPEHYSLARWLRNAKSGQDEFQICRVVDGKLSVLKSVQSQRLDQVWSQLTVRAWGRTVQVFTDDYPVLAANNIELSSGKVGLWVAGGTAVFDNFEVRPVRILQAGLFRNRNLWQLETGKWKGFKDGRIEATGRDRALALIGKPRWKDYVVRAEMQVPKKGSAGLLACRSANGGSYSYECGARSQRLVRHFKGKDTVLAEAPMKKGAGNWLPVSLVRVGALLMAKAGGERVLDAWDDALEQGPAGLFAGPATPAVFRHFEVEFLDPASFAQTIENYSFSREKVVDPTDVLDLTPEQYRKTVASAQQDLLKREAKFYAMIDPSRDKALWSPISGVCRVLDEKLHLEPGPGEARLYCNRQVPGDAAITVRLDADTPDAGEVAISISGSRADPARGYHLILKKGPQKTLSLLRGSRTVVVQSVKSLPTDGATLSLWKSGNHLLGWIDGNLLLTFRDADPVTGDEVAVSARGAVVQVDSTELKSLKYLSESNYYLFDRPEPDWLPVDGVFQVHGGISCQRASSWVSFLERNHVALTWNKRIYRGDPAVSFRAMEFSQWFGWTRNPTHIHTVYENIGVSLCSDGKDVNRGYAVIINGWTLQKTLILKNGKIVASLNQGPDFPCTFRGGHAPVAPRGSNFSVTLKKGVLAVLVNGIRVLSYEDPAPLDAGMVGLWTWDARMNLGDISINARASNPLSPERLNQSLEAGAGSVLRLVRAAEKSLAQPIKE